MSFKIYTEPDINRLLATFRGEIPDRVPYLVKVHLMQHFR